MEIKYNIKGVELSGHEVSLVSEYYRNATAGNLFQYLYCEDLPDEIAMDIGTEIRRLQSKSLDFGAYATEGETIEESVVPRIMQSIEMWADDNGFWLEETSNIRSVLEEIYNNEEWKKSFESYFTDGSHHIV